MAIIFIIVPTIFLFVKAVTPVSADYDNWQLVKTASTWNIMLRSILIGIATALVCLILAFPFAYIITQSKSQKYRLYIIAFTLAPFFIFTLTKILGIKSLFFYIFGESQAFNQSWFAIFGLVYLNLPFTIIPLYSVLSNMPKNLIEASHDLGYNRFQTLYKVVLPYGYRALFSGFALVFMLAATSIAVSDKLIFEPYKLPLIANTINNLANIQNEFNLAQASSLAIVTTAIMLSLYALFAFMPKAVIKIKEKINNGKIH